ncbi:hypothetical protein [Saccharothrix algeriensis]|uniref:Uncharacterized protein n=1 Tax=Saccharothrix algeriensis TaxID=173560 RepID=A0ABS2SC29_9PSEU|nr:hypothetical protein [Saccharothrix algeriensis]MBM7812843.1 hypothetical protein [Saccharothrix algeriensis]
MSGAPWTAFGAAAKRHHADAEVLARVGRHGNADHLAGVAAECGLKAILVGFLGGAVNAKGFPGHPAATKPLGHLPELWGQIALAADGRSGAQFSALILTANPFSEWEVSERYSDGAHITSNRAADHIAEAARVIAVHEQAVIDGVLP